MEKNKFIIAGCLIAVIFIITLILCIQRDTIFKNEIIITYPDGCTESFINGELQTQECTQGRLLDQKQNINNGYLWNLNQTNIVD